MRKYHEISGYVGCISIFIAPVPLSPAPPGLPEDVSEWPAGELRKYLEQRSIRHKELDIIGQFGLTKNTWMEAKMAKKWTILDNMILYSSIEVALKYQSVILYRLLVELCEHFFFLVLCNSFTDPIHFVWLFGKPSILSHFLFNGSSWVYSFVEDCFEKIELVDRVKDAIARGVPKTLADTASPEASNAKAWGLGNYWSSGHCGINFTLILIPFLTLKMVID